ncbi:hypothetical protein LCGC14_2170640, partial [marine sediment metagenome]
LKQSGIFLTFWQEERGLLHLIQNRNQGKNLFSYVLDLNFAFKINQQVV